MTYRMSRVILGGGLSGLSAAYYLSKLPNEGITLIESSNRTGGWIRSNIQKTGTIFEQGPRTIRPRGEAGANTLKLIEELHLQDQIVPIPSNHPAAKNRMIYAKSGLHMLPNTFSALFKKNNLFSKALAFHLLNDLTVDRKIINDESIYDFTARRFGVEVADYLISPLICGVCAGNAREISVKFLMGQLFQYEQKYGSVSKGIVANIFGKKLKKMPLTGLRLRAKQEKWNIYSFTNGCESLPLALRDSISNKVQIKLNTTCEQIEFINGKAVLHTTEGTVIANHLISSIPSGILGNLLVKQHNDLATLLQDLAKSVSVCVINIQYDADLLSTAAFGLLVAPKEQLPILGIIFDSCCFPQTNKGTGLTLMLGGHWFAHYFGENPQEAKLLEVGLEQVKNILGISEKPTVAKVNILHNCLPQYVVGHSEKLQRINEYINNNKLPISLCGASYHGVGINDVILSAKNVADGLS